jgi:hypothetical protein
VARFDKAHPSGTFRARLEADWLEADVGRARAVALNANGRVVKGNPAGATGLRGIVALGMVRKARHPVDPMFHGEVLDITAADIAGTLVAGAPVYAIRATGALTMVSTGNQLVGHLVEIDRLVVRMPVDTTAGA